MEAVIRQPVEARLQPFVRERYGCPGCVPCYVLVRRYKPGPGQRQNLEVHMDNTSHVTVTFPLNVGDYLGGLYAQREVGSDPHVRIRRGPPLRRGRVAELQKKGLWPHPLRENLESALSPGDALLHQSDLLHGVKVFGDGSRYSMIVWFAETAQECADSAPEDYDEDNVY